MGRGKTRGESPALPPPCQLCSVLDPRYSHLPHSRAPGCRRTPAGHCHTAAGSAALRRENKVCKGISEDLGKAGPSALFPEAHGTCYLRGSRAQAPLPHGVCSAESFAHLPLRLVYIPPLFLVGGMTHWGESWFAQYSGVSGDTGLSAETEPATCLV